MKPKFKKTLCSSFKLSACLLVYLFSLLFMKFISQNINSSFFNFLFNHWRLTLNFFFSGRNITRPVTWSGPGPPQQDKEKVTLVLEKLPCWQQCSMYSRLFLNMLSLLYFHFICVQEIYFYDDMKLAFSRFWPMFFFCFFLCTYSACFYLIITRIVLISFIHCFVASYWTFFYAAGFAIHSFKEVFFLIKKGSSICTVLSCAFRLEIKQ